MMRKNILVNNVIESMPDVCMYIQYIHLNAQVKKMMTGCKDKKYISNNKW